MAVANTLAYYIMATIMAENHIVQPPMACYIKHFVVVFNYEVYQGSLTEGEGSVQLTPMHQLVYISSFF